MFGTRLGRVIVAEPRWVHFLVTILVAMGEPCLLKLGLWRYLKVSESVCV